MKTETDEGILEAGWKSYLEDSNNLSNMIKTFAPEYASKEMAGLKPGRVKFNYRHDEVASKGKKHEQMLPSEIIAEYCINGKPYEVCFSVDQSKGEIAAKIGETFYKGENIDKIIGGIDDCENYEKEPLLDIYLELRKFPLSHSARESLFGRTDEIYNLTSKGKGFSKKKKLSAALSAACVDYCCPLVARLPKSSAKDRKEALSAAGINTIFNPLERMDKTLDYLSKTLGTKEETKSKAEFVLTEWVKVGNFSGGNPFIDILAAYYIASILTRDRITQAEICKQTGTSPGSLSAHYRKMCQNLDMEIVLWP